MAFCSALEQLERIAYEATREKDLEIERAASKLLLVFRFAQAREERFTWERAWRLGQTSERMHETLFVEELKGLDPKKWNEPLPENAATNG